MTLPNEDEIDTLLTAIASIEEGTPTAQALFWCIDSRRMWRERALNAEDRCLHLERLIQARAEERSTVG